MPAVLLLATGTRAQSIAFQDATASALIPPLGGAAGVSVVDYDRDGWDDILFTTSIGPVHLFKNNADGTFSDQTAAAGLSVNGNYTAAVLADFDNDGNTDLFLGGRAGTAARLFMGTAEHTFVEDESLAGIAADISVGSATVADYDEDGYLDIFIATRDTTDILYRNTMISELSFEDVSAARGVLGEEQSVAMQSTWIDFDMDGDLDLFNVHDGTYQNRLYENVGNSQMPNIASVAQIASSGAGNGMGTAWSDYNNDGWPDAYITRIGKAGFFENNGDGTFSDIAASSGAEPNGMSWGTVFADFDLDGDEDLFVASTFGFDGTPSMLYENHKGRFTEIGTSAGVRFDLDSFGAARGDFNNDGLPDLVVTDSRGSSKLLINTTDTSNNWLKVLLVSETSNSDGIGATVQAIAGVTTLSRYIMAGDSYCSQSPPVAFFGLKTFDSVDTLRVIWDSGEHDVLTNLNANGTVIVRRTASSTAIADGPGLNATASVTHFPEPFATTTRFEIEGSSSPTTFVVFNLLGREVARRDVSAGQSNSFTFDGSALPTGIYYYKFETREAREVVAGAMTIVR
ncbi:MAG: T9SS type A sorting domain-containing protein [Rhodothermales bacterium]|nr:T9SS type A sorting domain-containing protein [Rhodothermales bacterium]